MRKIAVWAITLALGGAALAGPARTAAALAPGLAPARLPAPVSALYRPATFVHMVGRVYHIEKWVAEDLEGTLVDIQGDASSFTATLKIPFGTMQVEGSGAFGGSEVEGTITFGPQNLTFKGALIAQ